MGTKNTYNNYQFYETPALTKYLEEQSIKGYSFCGAVGSFWIYLSFAMMKTKPHNLIVSYVSAWIKVQMKKSEK